MCSSVPALGYIFRVEMNHKVHPRLLTVKRSQPQSGLTLAVPAWLSLLGTQRKDDKAAIKFNKKNLQIWNLPSLKGGFRVYQTLFSFNKSALRGHNIMMNGRFVCMEESFVRNGILRCTIIIPDALGYFQSNIFIVDFPDYFREFLKTKLKLT